MKIFLIGGTGLVGSYLLPKLIEKNYMVFALTRDIKKKEEIEKSGAYCILGDIRDLRSFKNVLPERPDVVILLAMPSVRPGKRLTTAMKENLRSETNDFFRNSINLGIRFNIPVILPGGTSYKTINDEIADETWPVLRKGLTEIGSDSDLIVDEAIVSGYPEVIQLIYGKIYGNGGLFRLMYNMAERRRSMVIGKGDNYIPNIYAGDAASAIVKAIEKMPVGEKFIIADDTPVTQKDFTAHMALLLNKKEPGHVPPSLVKLILGRDFFEVISLNCKVSNAKAKRMLDWQPQFPSYKEGLEATIKEIKEKMNNFI
jgi:nucleoside-diphosphate-sugar epimerase